MLLKPLLTTTTNLNIPFSNDELVYHTFISSTATYSILPSLSLPLPPQITSPQPRLIKKRVCIFAPFSHFPPNPPPLPYPLLRKPLLYISPFFSSIMKVVRPRTPPRRSVPSNPWSRRHARALAQDVVNAVAAQAETLTKPSARQGALFVPTEYYYAAVSCEWCTKDHRAGCPLRGLPPTFCAAHVHSHFETGQGVCGTLGCPLTHISPGQLSTLLACIGTLPSFLPAIISAAKAGTIQDVLKCYNFMAVLGPAGTGVLIERMCEEGVSLATAEGWVQRVLEKHQGGGGSLRRLQPCCYYLLGVCQDSPAEGTLCPSGHGHHSEVPRHLLNTCRDLSLAGGCSRGDACKYPHSMVMKTTEVCQGFIKGACKSRLMCPVSHSYTTWAK